MAYGIKTRLDKSSVNKVMEDFKNLVEELKNVSDTNYINLKVKGFEQITKVDDELKKVNDTAKKTKDTFKDVDDSIKKTNDTMKGVGDNSKKVGDGFKSASDGARTFSEQMGHVIKKVAEWTIGTSVVFGVINQIRDGFKFVAEFDSHITTMAMLTGKSRQEIQGMTGDMNDMAKSLATNTNEIANGYEVWLRAGETIKDTRELLKDTTKLGVISGDGSKKTSEYLIAIKNAYGKNIEQVKQYTDKVALLDSATATCASNINKAFVGVAQTAKSQGLSENFLLGSIATIQSNSKMNPKSVGRLYKSVLLNIRKVKEEGKNAVSDLEANLNKHGIALRKNAKEWKNSEVILKDLIKNWDKFDGVTKSLIQQQIAGKTGAELFGIMAQQSDDLFKNIKKCENATGALDKKYQQYLESTEGKMQTLKATCDGMWLSLVNSKIINKGIGGLTTLVKLVQEFAEHNKLLGVTLIGLSVGFVGALKNVNMLALGINGIKMACLGLATNPMSAWVVGIGVAITGIIALVNHMRKAREHQEELKKSTDNLKKSYKDLNEAIKKNDYKNVKSNYDKLIAKQKEYQGLLKQQKDLENKINKGMKGFDGKNGLSTDMQNSSIQLAQVKGKLKELQTVLSNANIVINTTTGEIQGLTQAQAKVFNEDLVNRIKDTAQAELDNKKEVISLYNEYKNLNSIENKNAEQKRRLGEVTTILQSKVTGLITTRDVEGNAVIKNTDLINAEIGVLNTEGSTCAELTAIKLENAKQQMKIECAKTDCTYAEANKRIAKLRQEANLASSMSSYFKDSALDSVQKFAGVKTYEGRFSDTAKQLKDEADSIKKEVEQKNKEINDMVSKINVGNSKASHGNYFGGVKPSKGRKSKKGSAHKDSPILYDGKQESLYEATLKSLNDILEKTDNKIAKITQTISNLQSLESKSNFKDILTQENNKLDAQRDKLQRLQSATKQVNALRDKVANEITAKWGRHVNKNQLASMNEAEWTALYNKLYGKDVNFGTGDNAKKKQKVFQENANKFKELKSTYLNLKKASEDYNNSELKLTQEINSTIKEKIEIQSKMFEQQTKISQDKIKKAEFEKDLLSKNDKDRLYYSEDLLKVNDESLKQNYDIYNQLIAQRDALQKNSAEWNMLNEQAEQYNEKIMDGNRTVQEQQKSIREMKYDIQIKQYEEILAKMQDDIGDTQDKVDVSNTTSANEIVNKLGLMDSILQKNLSYYSQLTVMRDKLNSQKNKLEKDTDEWKKINEQVEQYNEKIDESTKSIANQQKEIARLQWQEELKRYNKVLTDKKDNMSNLQNELDMVNIEDKNDYGKRLAIMEKLVAFNENYVRQTEHFRDNLIKQRDELKKGSKEWETLDSKVKEYDNSIQNSNKSIAQQKSEIIKLKWDVQIKQYTEVLNARKEVLGDLQTELDILNTQSDKENEDNIKKLAYMQKILEVNKDYLNKVTDMRDKLVKQRDDLKQGSSEWENINNKVKEYDNLINNSTKSIAQQNKALDDLLKTRTRLLLETQKKNEEKQLDKGIFNVGRDDWEQYHKRKIQRLKREIDEANQFIKENGKSEYTDDELSAKNLELEQAQKETYENIKNYQEIFDDVHNQRIQAIDDELKRLDDKNEKEKIAEEREKRRLDLEKLRLELENTRNQKNIRQLTKDKNGLYQFVYVADQKKIEDLEEQIKDKQEDNVKWEQDLQDQEYRKKLQKEKKFEEDMMKAKHNFYNKEHNKLQEHYQDMDKLTKEYLEKLKEQYDNSYEDMLAMLETELESEKEIQTQSQEDSLKSKQEYYKEQIEKLDNHYDDKLKKADRQYRDEQRELERHHDKEINEIDSHYKEMDNLVEVHLEDLKTTYSHKWDEILDVLKEKVKEAEELQKKLMELGGGSSSSSNGSHSSSYEKAKRKFLDAKANGNNDKADKVRNDYSNSKNKSGSYSREKAERDFLDAKASGDNDKADRIRDKYSSFDTGGYTGTWGKDGKLAILHEKELVLNKYQTKDILKASELLSKVNPLSNITMPKLNLPSPSDLGINNKQPQVVKNIYQVDKVECPNVTNDSGINNMFENLTRLGSQYNPEPTR